MTDSTALPPPLLKRMLKAEAAACRECNTSERPVTVKYLMYAKNKVTLDRLSMGVTQDMQEGCRQYLSDACVRVHQGALHSGEEDPQVLCKLLPGDVV